MVLVVLAVAWVGVLAFWIRSRTSQGAFTDSVGTFHRHLRVLERAAPGTVTPAYRLRDPTGAPVSISTRPGRAAPAGRLAPLPSRPAGLARSAASGRRRQIRRRRRDVLFVLLVAVAATAVLALGTGSHPMMVVQLASDAALVAYVAMLVRLRNLAAERDLKLRVLQRPTRYPAASGYGDLALRRVAN